MAKTVVGVFEAILGLNDKGLVDGLNRADKSINSFSGKASKSVDKIAHGFKKVELAAKGFIAAFAVQKVMDFAHFNDGFRVLEARIAQTVSTQAEFTQSLTQLSALSSSTGVALEPVVGVYQRLTTSMRALGKTNTDVLALTGTLMQLGAISGTSIEAMRGGLLQFGQAMGGSIVRAEEFNSILEGLPAVTNKIAEGMGKSVPELRNMMLAGKLLSADVMNVLLAQTAEIQAEFDRMPATLQKVQNKAVNALGEILSAIDANAEGTNGFYNTLSRVLDLILGMKEPIVRTFLLVTSSFSQVSNLVVSIGSMVTQAIIGQIGMVAVAADRAASVVHAAFSTIGAGGITQGLKDATKGAVGLAKAENKTQAAFTANSLKKAFNFSGVTSAMFGKLKTPTLEKGKTFRQFSAAPSLGGGGGSRGGGGGGRGGGGRGGGESPQEKALKQEAERLKGIVEGMNSLISGGFGGASLTSYYKQLEDVAFAFKKGAIDATAFAQATAAIDNALKQAISGVTQADFDKVWAAKVTAPMEAFSESVMTDFDTGVEAMKAQFTEVRAFLEAARTPLERYNDELLKLGQLFAASEGAISQEQFTAGIKALDEDLARAQGRFIDWEATVGQWSNTFIDSLSRGQFEFKNFAAAILADVARMIFQFTVLNKIKALFDPANAAAPATAGSAGGGFLGSVLGGVGKFFGGFFANGGSPPLGKTSIVGERGPELFVPKQAGTIIPNGAGFGASTQTVYQNFYIDATDPASLKKQLQAQASTIGGIALQYTQAASNKRGRRGPLE